MRILASVRHVVGTSEKSVPVQVIRRRVYPPASGAVRTWLAAAPKRPSDMTLVNWTGSGDPAMAVAAATNTEDAANADARYLIGHSSGKRGGCGGKRRAKGRRGSRRRWGWG